MASTMLSAAIGQYSSVLPLLCYCLPVFDKMSRIAMNFVFLSILALPEYSMVRLVAS